MWGLCAEINGSTLTVIRARVNTKKTKVAKLKTGKRSAADAPDASIVLSKAVLNAAERLDVSRAALADILCVSPLTITRLYSGEYRLEQNRKEWDLALLFVRAFLSLESLIGDEGTARKWLHSHNPGLNGRPIDSIKNTEGLVRVVEYLEAYRGIV